MSIRFEERKREVLPEIQMRVRVGSDIWGLSHMIDLKDIHYSNVPEHYAAYVAHAMAYKAKHECPIWSNEVQRALSELLRWRRALFMWQNRQMLIPPMVPDFSQMRTWRGVPLVLEFGVMETYLMERITDRVYHSIMHWKEDRT